VIRHGDADAIDRFIFQGLAYVLIVRGAVPLLLFGNFIAALFTDIFIGIANGNHFGLTLAGKSAEVSVAAIVHAANQNAELFVGALGDWLSGGGEQLGRRSGRSGNGRGQH